MTQTLIEQLNGLQRFTRHGIEGENGAFILADDLRAIIEQHKQESGEDSEPAAWMFVGNLAGTDLLSFDRPTELNSIKGSEVPIYTSPQPSHTQLIGELVQALDRYSCSASLSDELNALRTKAREAVKHE